MQSTPPHEQQEEPASRRNALLGLIVVAVLVVAGYFLVNALRENSNMEDCLMSGRKNCALLDTSNR